MMHLQDIYIYPIKSLGGNRVETCLAEERGLKYDRRWMLVDQNGRFLSQREHPSLALLKTEMTDSGIQVHHKEIPSFNILVPFEPQTDQFRQVTIWGDKVPAQLVDKRIGKWFSKQLGQDCELVFMPESTQRKVDPAYAINHESVSFADGMPFLLISQASLDDLNSRLANPVPMNRFRPNLVVAGGEAFQEDEWGEISIGKAVFNAVKPCARCVVTTIDQQTSKKGKEPLKTLAGYRSKNNKVLFGQNLVLKKGAEINVGDSILP